MVRGGARRPVSGVEAGFSAMPHHGLAGGSVGLHPVSGPEKALAFWPIVCSFQRNWLH